MSKHTKEQIQAIAESILPEFIPKDTSAEELTFHFTIPPKSSYKVIFQKDLKGDWKFETFSADNDNM